MTIEERAAQLGETLGAQLGEPLVFTDANGQVMRVGRYYQGLLVEIDGEVWTAAEATQAQRFDPPRT